MLISLFQKGGWKIFSKLLLMYSNVLILREKYEKTMKAIRRITRKG